VTDEIWDIVVSGPLKVTPKIKLDAIETTSTMDDDAVVTKVSREMVNLANFCRVPNQNS